MQFIEILLFGSGVFKYLSMISINFTYILNFVCLYTFRNVCIGDKLLHTFARECYERNTAPSVFDFYEWCQSVKKPKLHTDTHIYKFFYNMYRFLMEAIFTYILAVYMFRAGVRRNNTDVIMASSVKFSTIYFGISKTNYQKIEIIDITTRVGAPPDVQTYFQQHESFFRKI